MMGNRSTLVVFLVLVLIIIILAQNGYLGNIFRTDTDPSDTFGAPPSGGPFGFSTAVPNSGFIMPTAFIPTAYVPPAYAPTLTPAFGANPSSPINNNANNAAPPVGVVSATGQCIVPNGWRPYTIQAGETLAGIAAVFNLTADQLAAANCMTNPDLIYEGQIIAVP